MTKALDDLLDILDLEVYEMCCHQPLLPSRSEIRWLSDRVRLTQRLGLDTEVEDLFRRRKAVLEVDSVNRQLRGPAASSLPR